MMRIAGALGALQLVMIVLSWLLSPVGLLAWLCCGGWCALLVVVTWHGQWLGGVARWRRWLCLVLWQLPGLAAGSASVALLAQWWHGPSIVVFILQAWLQPFAPFVTCAPHGSWGGVAPYLWLAAVAPAAQVLALGVLGDVLAARGRRALLTPREEPSTATPGGPQP